LTRLQVAQFIFLQILTFAHGLKLFAIFIARKKRFTEIFKKLKLKYLKKLDTDLKIILLVSNLNKIYYL